MATSGKPNFVAQHLQREQEALDTQVMGGIRHPSILAAGINLSKYRATGHGERLFNAYAAWRDATKDAAEQRSVDLVALLNPEPGAGISYAQFAAATDELAGLQILAELDAVVGDLRKVLAEFREKDSTAKYDPATALRAALRIAKGTDPSTALADERRRLHVALFINSYDAMQGDFQFRSDTAIAKQIAGYLAKEHRQFGLASAVGWETVLADWKMLLEGNPSQNKWAREIRSLERICAGMDSTHDKPDVKRPRKVKKPAIAAPSRQAPPRNTKKPASWRAKL